MSDLCFSCKCVIEEDILKFMKMFKFVPKALNIKDIQEITICFEENEIGKCYINEKEIDSIFEDEMDFVIFFNDEIFPIFQDAEEQPKEWYYDKDIDIDPNDLDSEDFAARGNKMSNFKANTSCGKISIKDINLYYEPT